MKTNENAFNVYKSTQTIKLVQAFNGKKWEKFNSEKVASLAYARIQGKAALVTHFQNSSLMNEDKRCRPILFHSEGQETSDQVICLSYMSSFVIMMLLSLLQLSKFDLKHKHPILFSDIFIFLCLWILQETFLSRNLNICIRQPDGSYLGDSLDSPKGDLDEKPENS